MNDAVTRYLLDELEQADMLGDRIGNEAMGPRNQEQPAACCLFLLEPEGEL